jgi:hypothetical protein
MNDEKKYKPYVAASEMTISRKAWFVATSLVRTISHRTNILKPLKCSLREVLPSSDGMRYSKVHCPSGAPKRDDVTNTEKYHAERINPFGPLERMELIFANGLSGVKVHTCGRFPSEQTVTTNRRAM